LNSECDKCGLARLWSGEDGIRKTLFKTNLTGNKEEVLADVDPVWKRRVKWSRYAYRPKEESTRKKQKEDDESYADKKSRELFIEPRAGTLVEFLDEMETVLSKYIVHRGIMCHQTESRAEFDRMIRPGIVAIDHDYAENMNLLACAREVQSEYWSKKQCTLFNAIVHWVDKIEWNKTEGDIPVGDAVTVFGEKAGEEVNADSFWAKVIAVPTMQSSDYIVEDVLGKEHYFPRRMFRHRVVKKQAHVGVTPDGKHDTYSMRHFITMTVQNLKSNGVFERENFTVLCFHTDNASQHFKSSNSINWLSQQLLSDAEIRSLGFRSALWDFGAPGHGKGPWDGIGGMLKQWMLRRVISELHPRDPEILESELIDEERIATAKGCYDAWVKHFCSESYEQSIEGDNKKIKFVFHYAGPDESPIIRPNEESFDRIESIKSCYQFFMIRTGEVLARHRSCWCLGCLSVAMRGPGEGTKLTSDYNVGFAGCSKSNSEFYTWSNKSCRCKEGVQIAERESKLKQLGHDLAEQVQIGDWLLFEAFNDEEDEMWLARAVPFPNRQNTCTIQHTGTHCHKFNTRFDAGDFMIAVQFYERSPDCDDERRLFVMGEEHVDVLNSTELRGRGFMMDTAQNTQSQGVDTSIWLLPREIEAKALLNCR
jgi:hypothetical protein